MSIGQRLLNSGIHYGKLSSDITNFSWAVIDRFLGVTCCVAMHGQVVCRNSNCSWVAIDQFHGATVYMVGDWDPGATFGTQWFGMYQWAGWTASTWSNEDWDILLAEKKKEALDALTRVAI